MTTALQSLFDIATQPRRSSMFRLHRVSKLNAFSPRLLDQYASQLGQHLIREFRVSKQANKDSTIGICRELDNDLAGMDGFEDEDLFIDTFAGEDLDGEAGGGEFGMCVVFEAHLAPDHAKIDGQLGPRTSLAEIVLCLGREVEDEEDDDDDADEDKRTWRFAFALTRGKLQLISSMWAFLHAKFAVKAVRCEIAPHHLAHLAHVWSRDSEQSEEEIRLLRRAKKLRKRNYLEIEFLLPASTATEGGGGGNTIRVTIEEDNLIRLHSALVSRQMQQRQEEEDEEEGAQVAAAVPPPVASQKLVDVLTSYIAEHLKIDLSGACVTQIMTPTAELFGTGEVRFYWPSHLKRAMMYIAKCCQTKVERLQ